MSEPRRVRVDHDVMPTRRRDSRPAVKETGPPSECDCPRLEAGDWDDAESDWGDITFVRMGANAILGVPLGYDGIRAELERKAAAIGGTVPEDAMYLMGEGRFRRPVLLEVENVAPGTKGIEAPGGFVYTRLVPAPWGELRKLVDETARRARAKYGRSPDHTWLWYLTCRVCSTERNFETLIVAHYQGPAGA